MLSDITMMEIAAFASFVVAVLTILRTYSNQAVRITRFGDEAKAAKQAAEDASREAEAAIALAREANAGLARFREHVAREYTSKEAIREMEARLVSAIDRLGERFDKYIDKDRA